MKRGFCVCLVLSFLVVFHQISEHLEYSYWKVLVKAIHDHNGSNTGAVNGSRESTVNLSLSQEPQPRCSGTPQCDAACMEFQNYLKAQPADRPKAAVYYLVHSDRIQNLGDSLKALDKYFNNRFQYPVITVPFTPKVNTQTHFVFLKCAAARRRAMCEIHMHGQRTFGAVPILNLSLGAPKCDHV